MTQSIQEAMLKAGLVTKEKLKQVEQEKKAASRPPRPQRPVIKPPFVKLPVKTASKFQAKPSIPKPEIKKREPAKHLHHIRTDCEGCRKSSPDVEHYLHTNRSFNAFWLCVRCADAHNISDECRQTIQSQHAMSGLFRREYGATKVFRK